MAVLADLLVRFGADSAELRKTLKTVDSELKHFTHSVEGIKKALEGAFAVVGIHEIGSALKELVVSGVEAADQMGKLAEKAGVSVEALSGLNYAAALSDVSTQDLGTALARLSKSMGAAARGTGEQADAFRALGVEVVDSEGNLRNATDVLADIADRFAVAEDGAAKAAYAQALFGRSGADLIPLLNKGSAGLREMRDEAASLGLIISGETAKAADELTQNFHRLHLESKAFSVVVAADLNPMLKNLSDSFIETAGAGGAMEATARTISTALKVIATAAGGAWYNIKMFGDVASSTLAASVLSGKGDYGGAFNVLKGIPRELWDESVAWEKRVTAIWSDAQSMASHSSAGFDAQSMASHGKGKLPPILSPEAHAAAKKTKDELATIKNLLVDLETQAATFGKEPTDVLRYRLETGDLAKELEKFGPLSEGYKESILKAAGALDELKRKEKATADAMKAFNDLVSEAEGVYEATRTPAEKYANEMERLQRLLSETAIDQETFDRAAKKAADEFGKSTEKMSESMRRLGQGIEDVLTNQLENGFKDGLAGMLDAFGAMLKRMLAEAAAARIAQSILGGLGGLPGLGASVLGPIFGGGTSGSGGGGGTGGMTAPEMLATGGVASVGSPYIVGERGPELFVPNVSGRVIPNDQLAAGGGRSETVHRLVFDDRYRHMTLAEWFESHLANEAATR